MKKYYPPSSITNMFPCKGGALERVGYANIWGLLWQIYLINRKCRKYKNTVTMNFKLPIKH